MTPTLGGRGESDAVIWSGRRLSYDELDAAVEQWPHLPVHDASELPLPEALICVFAAARQGAAVCVEDPAVRPVRPAPTGGAAHPEAFLLVATSGSTGRPKPLARTAASWVDSFPEFTEITDIRATDSVLITGPLHATMHLFAAVHALWLGACVTDDPSIATVVHAVPAVLRELVHLIPDLRVVVAAGTALDSQAAHQVRSRGVRAIEYYGSAELSLVAARVVGEQQALRLLRAVDARTQAGLLFVRSPYCALSSEPGWVGVGDLAEVRGRELAVHGRGDAAIDVGGTTVIAEDVERILTELDGVRAAAAIGSPHPVLGETVSAVIELDGSSDLAAIRAAARAVMSKEALPRRWTVVPQLPRTSNGKISRGALR